MTALLNPLQTAYVLMLEDSERIGEMPDGWIIGGHDLHALRACKQSHVAMIPPAGPEEPERLFGLPITVHGRDGVYPTHDRLLASSMRWFTTAGPEPWIRIIRVFGEWQGREFAYSHVVDTNRARDLPRILAHMDLACRRLAFTPETQGPPS